ncbi:Putative pterin-4-alpha-carbinolamine dehydratase [Streptomyces sp. YIM 121038]|uniref:4a-hydroxytetrahydrobiopterin dehydratase n=1 Tax=Streptomyces sp. YIM 121038 TaxID=2136401 RepID=UPI0011109DBB|nr:4a-hydroxytetrahydrobiopterin dehydratase [Streptomyces sp. YIM 121038]QCX80076.1 Putative pterin-4-alpha-carbinolamine dehydratase [Streptomyces sp. YIM 121038]
MPLEPLSQKEIEDRLAELPGWSVTENAAGTGRSENAGSTGRSGSVLTRSYRLGSHYAATALVVHVSQVQQELDHHAEITLGYDTVALAVCTHSAGGALTERDFELARRVEELAPGHGAA